MSGEISKRNSCGHQYKAIYIHVPKYILCKQRICSKILNVINSEVVLKRATRTLCTKKLNTLCKTTMCTTSILVTFKAKLNSATPTES